MQKLETKMLISGGNAGKQHSLRKVIILKDISSNWRYFLFYEKIKKIKKVLILNI